MPPPNSSLCGLVEIYNFFTYTKKEVVCPEEKSHKIWGVFSNHSVETGTKRFLTGIRMTQDRVSMLTRR
jgi:hypothetical protein